MYFHFFSTKCKILFFSSSLFIFRSLVRFPDEASLIKCGLIIELNKFTLRNFQCEFLSDYVEFFLLNLNNRLLCLIFLFL